MTELIMIFMKERTIALEFDKRYSVFKLIEISEQANNLIEQDFDMFKQSKYYPRIVGDFFLAFLAIIFLTFDYTTAYYACHTLFSNLMSTIEINMNEKATNVKQQLKQFVDTIAKRNSLDEAHKNSIFRTSRISRDGKEMFRCTIACFMSNTAVDRVKIADQTHENSHKAKQLAIEEAVQHLIRTGKIN